MIKGKKKTSLGLVLTEQYMEAVCVEISPAQETHVCAGRMALPAGLLRNGRFTAPAKAAGLLQKLLSQEKITIRKATVLVPDTQSVAQILDLPTDLPANIHKFIHTEIRYSPILTKQTPYSDYRTLGTDEEGREKILIGAVPKPCIENLVYTLSLAGVEILSLEMDFCALYRAVYSRILSGQKPESLFLASITGKTLTICVFLKNKLDFVQRFSLPIQMEAVKTAALKQLQTIKQYYEIERGYSFHQQWKIMIVLDTIPVERQEWVSDLQILFGDAADLVTPLDLPLKQKPRDAISLAGLGLALKNLESSSGLPVPELLPRFFKDHYAWKRTTRLTAMIAAGLVLVLYACTWIFQTICSAQGNPARLQETRMVQLAEEQKQFHKEIEMLGQIEHMLLELSRQETHFSYSSILKEIAVRVPKGLQVTTLEMSATGAISIEGKSLSFQTIHQFASGLQESSAIASAAVEKSRISPSSSRIYEFQILCQVRQNDQKGTGL